MEGATALVQGVLDDTLSTTAVLWDAAGVPDNESEISAKEAQVPESPIREPLDTYSFHADLLLFGENVRAFRDADVARRHQLRSPLVSDIKQSTEPDRFIAMLLREILASRKAGRLDDAIDILAELGHPLEMFVRRTIGQEPEDRREENYWYVLIRALGRSVDAAMFRAYVPYWIGSNNRSIREAVVEALGEENHPASAALLRQMAATDKSRLVQELASNVVKELSE